MTDPGTQQGTDASTPNNDSGTTPTNDASYPTSDSGTNQPPTSYLDPFQGAPAYSAGKGSNAHNAGQACITCHTKQGEKSLLIGGTVYSDYDGTTPAAGVEIRVLDTQGHAMSTYSGTSGTFYISANSTIVPPFVVGVRNASATRPMITQIDGKTINGDCSKSGCHVGKSNGGYYVVHIP